MHPQLVNGSTCFRTPIEEGQRASANLVFMAPGLLFLSHGIHTIFIRTLLRKDKSDFMQEESLGFQLTRGHVADLLNKKKRKNDDKEEDRETEGSALLINMT